ncbi:GmrSD restriction endonuclease domain-containing protein [Microbacterium sp. gxy059]|uniref:GmrSD restriction endonuclease domain-containing protein n=1 Tax=Microbacterium sp. gxy059 TaxID=2957199 RepID=UPI003D96E833
MAKQVERREALRRPVTWVLLAVLIVAVAVSAGVLADDAPRPFPQAAEGTALHVAQDLDVKGRAPRTGYSRDEFGAGWVDVDRNGCDTRNDVLNRDLDRAVHRDGTHGCVVESGVLADPFSGSAISFTRGEGTSSMVQIDHVVALSDAWQKGAQGWTTEKRTAFANDPLNLLAVDGPLNAQKGDGDAATWLPPNGAFRCPYVARQVAVKATYDVWVTEAELDAMVRVLSECPDEPLPDGSAPVSLSGDAGGTAGGGSEPTVPGGGDPGNDPSDGSDPVEPFANCAAARDAGAAPVRRGDPGYGPHLDGDGDGIACE